MGRARKRGRGTKAGVGVKKGKKIRPVKLKRRQAPLNARARERVSSYPKNFRKLMRTLVDAVRYKSGLIITNPGVPPR